MSVPTRAKLANLHAKLHRLKKVALAFSGGLDSTFLLRVARDLLSGNVVAITASSPIRSSGELIVATNICRQMDVKLIVVTTRELDNEQFRSNTPERCYHCKNMLFSTFSELAHKNGYDKLIDGSNADDLLDSRPGLRAAREANICSPLAEVGFTKSEIRSVARELSLPNWDQPSNACLCSRIPYHTPLSEKLLRKIEEAEAIVLKTEERIRQVRVRHYGATARIEVLPEQIALLAEPRVRKRLVEELGQLGYSYVSVDLEGYQTGSLNKELGKHV